MATQLQEPVEAEVIEEQTEARDFEVEARKMGWKPEEEFEPGERRPREIKDAETFVREGEERPELQKQTIAQLKKKISMLETGLRRVMRSEQAAHADKLAALKAQQREAVVSGDTEAFEALDAAAEKLRKDIATDTPSLNGEDPAEQLDTFRESNPWFDKANLASASEVEIEARLFVDRLADKWIRQGLPNEIPPSEFYKRLEDAAKAKFPTLGAKPARAKPQSDVAGVTTRVAARGAKTGANLPADAKAHAERYMRMKVPGFAQCKSVTEAHNLFAQTYQWES